MGHWRGRISWEYYTMVQILHFIQDDKKKERASSFLFRKRELGVLFSCQDWSEPHRVSESTTNDDEIGHHSRDREMHQNQEKKGEYALLDHPESLSLSPHLEQCRNVWMSQHCPFHRKYASETNHFQYIQSPQGVHVRHKYVDLHRESQTILMEAQEMDVL